MTYKNPEPTRAIAPTAGYMSDFKRVDPNSITNQMTVGQFIEVLKTKNQDAHVLVEGYEYGHQWLRPQWVVEGKYKHPYTECSVITQDDKDDIHLGVDVGSHNGLLEPDPYGKPCVFLLRSNGGHFI